MIFLDYVAFPNRNDSIITNTIKQHGNVQVQSSGSQGLWTGSKCVRTNPNSTIETDKTIDWCSNIGLTDHSIGKPWISYSIKDKIMKVTGFTIRNGCCWYDCCCNEQEIQDVRCCCRLSKFALEGSNDNITWDIVYKIQKDTTFHYCEFKTFTLDTTYTYRFFRFILDEEYGDCIFCMQINQIDFYGDTFYSPFPNRPFVEDIDEPISIIGKIKKNNHNF